MDVTMSGFLNAANRFADKEHRKGLWQVWPKYEIRSRKDGGRYVLAVEPDLPPRVDLEKALEKTNGLVAPNSPEMALLNQAVARTKARKEVWPNWPLVSKPDLFLKFARLADDGGLDNGATLEELDTDKNAAAALEWAEVHGVLGLTAEGVDEFLEARTRGGTAETVAAFAYEAWVANGCLRLYEAATAEELDMDLIASYFDNPRYKSHYTRTPAIAREFALGVVATETQKRVTGNAYPAFYGVVGRFVSGWSFTTLLGAMWLQMFWLLTASEAPRRCSNWECDKIIAYEQPDRSTRGMKRNDRSGGYVTRKDKRFCHKRCRDRYHYLTKTKPRRHVARDL
jgi:hypothetical protein